MCLIFSVFSFPLSLCFASHTISLSLMSLFYSSEAKWYHSHLNDETASEKLSDTFTVPTLVNSGTRRQEMPENWKIIILPS